MSTPAATIYQRKRPHHAAPPVALTEVDVVILRAVNQCHYLTAAQLGRLLYNGHDENRYSQRRLKRLVDAGYLLRLRDLPAPRFGSAPHVFTLGTRGRQYLRQLGVPVDPRYHRPTEEREKALNNPFMTHTLAAVDVLVAVNRLCLDIPQVSCPRMLSERELKLKPLRVNVPPVPGATGASPQLAVIPDAWFQLSVAGGEPLSIALEMDLNTEHLHRFQTKVAALAAWAKGPYREAFATDNLTVAVVTSSARRRDQLRAWTRTSLTKRGLGDLLWVFLFTDASPVTLPPARFFFEPLWYPPEGSEPVSLLDPPTAAQGEISSGASALCEEVTPLLA